MKLWLIERTDTNTGYTHYDETYAMVVRASDADSARSLAIDGLASWDGFKTAPLKVTEVTPEGEPAVIIVDFLAG